jgi:MarR family transcriptional regulator for hemolysin
MDSFAKVVSDKLSEIYIFVTNIEENALKDGNIQLSISEINLLTKVSKHPYGLTLSDLAEELRVTRPTATVAVSKLAAKGYVRKRSSDEDGRSIMIMLTPEGRRTCFLHQRCQKNAVTELSEELSEEEKVLLLKVLDGISRYLKENRMNGDAAD